MKMKAFLLSISKEIFFSCESKNKSKSKTNTFWEIQTTFVNESLYYPSIPILIILDVMKWGFKKIKNDIFALQVNYNLH